MKINPTAAYQAYNKISEHSHAARRLGAASELPAQKAENTDRIHISPEASRQLEVEQLSRSILSEIRSPPPRSGWRACAAPSRRAPTTSPPGSW